MTRLTAIVLTFNEAAQIGDCIESLRFADRILVFDSYSSDGTADLARGCGADVLQRRFDDYAAQRNAALAAVAAETDWALFVDADERVTAPLAIEIREKMELPDYAAWRLPRRNYIFGVLTQGAGWHPDYQTRLLRSGRAYYDPTRPVHEAVLADGPEGALAHPLIHYNYRDLPHFLEKQRRYARYDAAILFRQGVRPRPHSFVWQPMRHFYWRFITLAGCRDGWHGFKLSLLMAWYEFHKYRVLRSLWQQEQR